MVLKVCINLFEGIPDYLSEGKSMVSTIRNQPVKNGLFIGISLILFRGFSLVCRICNV